MLRFRKPCGEEFAKQRFERSVRGDELIVGSRVMAFCADGGEEITERGFVFVGDEIGLGDEGGAVLEIDKAVRAVELKADFERIHQMEDGDVMLAVAKVLECITKGGGVGEEIG